MHGKTFNHIKPGEPVTVWGCGQHRGSFGHVVKTEGLGKQGRGDVTVRLADGTEVVEGYRNVACGDNSKFKDED